MIKIAETDQRILQVWDLGTWITQSQPKAISEALLEQHNTTDPSQVYFYYDQEMIRGKIATAEFYGTLNHDQHLILTLEASVDISATLQTWDDPQWLHDIHYQAGEYQFLMNASDIDLRAVADYFECVVRELEAQHATFTDTFETVHVYLKSRIPRTLIGIAVVIVLAFLAAYIYIGYSLQLGRFESGTEEILMNHSVGFLYLMIPFFAFLGFNFLLKRLYIYNSKKNTAVVKIRFYLFSLLAVSVLVGLLMIFIIVFPVHRLGNGGFPAFTLIPNQIRAAYDTLVSWNLIEIVAGELTWLLIGMFLTLFIAFLLIYADFQKRKEAKKSWPARKK